MLTYADASDGMKAGHAKGADNNHNIEVVDPVTQKQVVCVCVRACVRVCARVRVSEYLCLRLWLWLWLWLWLGVQFFLTHTQHNTHTHTHTHTFTNRWGHINGITAERTTVIFLPSIEKKQSRCCVALSLYLSLSCLSHVSLSLPPSVSLSLPCCITPSLPLSVSLPLSLALSARACTRGCRGAYAVAWSILSHTHTTGVSIRYRAR
jgi:hypothetical protein